MDESTSSSLSRAARVRQTIARVTNEVQRLRPYIMTAISPPIPRQRIYINRDRVRAYEELWNLYFSPNCMYSDSMFRRRFRMRRELFFRIQKDIESANSYFTQRPDATGRLGIHSLQKMTVALRMLAYGVSADSLDEKFLVAESTAIESLKMFCKTIIQLYATQYLREPTNNDIARLFEEGEERGFPGMLGSLDCMHWVWKNCPTA